MTISTDALIKFWEGSYASLDDTSGAVSSGSFSVTGDLLEWTNTDDADRIACILEIDPASAPAAGGYVFLYAQMLNIISTTDATFPSANFPHTPIGRFPVDIGAGLQTIYNEFWLPSSKTQQEIKFVIKNGTDVSIDAGWDLNVDSMTVGPHV